jgi:hypothetical protein
VLLIAVGAVLAAPPLDLGEKIDQFGAAGCEPVVGAFGVLVVFHEFLFAEVVQGAGQGAGVYDAGTRLGYGVVELGVAQRPIAQGGEDRDVQLVVGQ